MVLKVPTRVWNGTVPVSGDGVFVILVTTRGRVRVVTVGPTFFFTVESM